MEEHHIIIPKTARYFQEGNLNKNTKEIWVVCHGYGQLAHFFLRKFDALKNDSTCIIAPEGMHRYYLEGSSGRVGASWMTKEDRLNDIKDYVNYLDQLTEKLTGEAPNAKVIILGFSQGCATVSRWVSLGNVNPKALILYAGVFPPDLDFDIDGARLKDIPVVLANGYKDEYMDEEALKKQCDVLQTKGISHMFILFEGKHTIYPEVLMQIREKISVY